MDDDDLLGAIQDIAVFGLGSGTQDEMREALSLIESICRHGCLVWTDQEERKYRPND
jgi:hypothetical protein